MNSILIGSWRALPIRKLHVWSIKRQHQVIHYKFIKVVQTANISLFLSVRGRGLLTKNNNNKNPCCQWKHDIDRAKILVKDPQTLENAYWDRCSRNSGERIIIRMDNSAVNFKSRAGTRDFFHYVPFHHQLNYH